MTSMHWFPSFGEQARTNEDADPFESSNPSLFLQHQSTSSSSSRHQSPSSARSPSPSSSLFCSAEQLFTLSSPWPHAPWKIMPSSSFSSFPGSNHFTNSHQQSPTAAGDSSFSTLRQKQQPDSSSIGSSSGSASIRRRGRRPPLHCRSRSDATAMTEASSSEEYYDHHGNYINTSSNHNRSSNSASSNSSSSSNLASTAFVTGSEMERAMWLVGMNNAAAHQYYNNSHQSSSSISSSLHVQQYQYDNSDALADDAAAVEAAEAAVERAQRILLDSEPPVEDPQECLIGASATAPHSVETFLSVSSLQQGLTTSITIMPDDDVGTSRRGGGGSDVGTITSSVASSANKRTTKSVTPVYHRYRHVGEFGHHNKHGGGGDSSATTFASTVMNRRSSSSSSSSSSKQDSLLLARKHQSAPQMVEADTTASTRGPPSSPTSVIAATPPASPSSKPLSKYKQHILKKHSFVESQKDEAAVTNQNSAVLLERPPKVTRRSQSVPRPPILATVVDGNGSRTYIYDYQHSDNHDVDTTTTTTTPATTSNTTSATARAMAKLVAARRARTHSHDGGSSSSSSTASPTNNGDTMIATTTTMLSEIVSPSNCNNTMVAGLQYIDSDDLLALMVKRNDSMCSAASVQSTPSTTPTVRAGTFNSSSAADRKTTISPLLTTITGSVSSSGASRHRRALSAPMPIGQPTLDDCDTSTIATPPLSGTASASNPVSIDECGPIDVDTGEEVDALIDSICVASPLYDSYSPAESRLTKQELLECLQEEERFRDLEFPIVDEVEITRGLASYMPGFEPRMEDVNSLALQQQQQQQQQQHQQKRTVLVDDFVDMAAWLNGVEIKEQSPYYAEPLPTTTREILNHDEYHHGSSARKRPSCMSSFKPKILSSLMCAVVTPPQYHLHSSNHSTHGDDDIDCHQQQQHTRPGQRGAAGGRTVFSISTTTGSALRSLGQDSRLTFEI